jgi:phosphoserine phosphatase
MKKGVVVDLDGTLLSTNTFQEYIVFSFKTIIKSGRCFTAFILLSLVICRKLRLIRHDTMKFHILNLINPYITQYQIKAFISTLLGKINKSVLTVLTEYKKNNYVICLSTAAPDIYVNELVKELFCLFDIICATPTPSKNVPWRENTRQIKCDSTLALLNSKNTKLSVLITDHFDDIPLLSIGKDLNILVKPSEQTIKKLNKYNVKYSIF